MESIVKTNLLTKVYGKKTVVNRVCMNVEKGDIYGFIGKNGAGKTTTMKLILGTVFSDGGEIKLFGSDDLNAGRARIGSLIEDPGLYKNCSARENMRRFSMIYGGGDKIEELLTLVGLDNVGKKQAGQFSLGMRQRLGIAIALLGEPEFLVLDEPLNGLDPTGIKEMRDLMLKLNSEKGITLLIASHLIDELSKVATKYGIIKNGVLVEEISAADLEERCRQNIKVTVDDVARAENILTEQYPDIKYTVNDNTLVITSNIYDRGRLNFLLVTGGVAVSELSVVHNSIENYFIERIGK